MTSKDDCVRKYAEYKTIHEAIPKKKDFFKFAGIHERQLTALFGRDAYSKLQRECGDEANKRRTGRRQFQQFFVAGRFLSQQGKEDG